MKHIKLRNYHREIWLNRLQAFIFQRDFFLNIRFVRELYFIPDILKFDLELNEHMSYDVLFSMLCSVIENIYILWSRCKFKSIKVKFLISQVEFDVIVAVRNFPYIELRICWMVQEKGLPGVYITAIFHSNPLLWK